MLGPPLNGIIYIETENGVHCDLNFVNLCIWLKADGGLKKQLN